MSQDIRQYPLIRVDQADNEASRMDLTATVGPSDDEIDDNRGVQLTLRTPNGYAYARVSEPQIRDLIETLKKRVDPENDDYEATLYGSGNRSVTPTGQVLEE